MIIVLKQDAPDVQVREFCHELEGMGLQINDSKGKPCREYGQSKLSFAGSGRTCYQPRLTVLGDAVQQFVWVPLRSHTFKISPRGNKRKICTCIFNWPVFLTVFSITQVGELYQ